MSDVQHASRVHSVAPSQSKTSEMSIHDVRSCEKAAASLNMQNIVATPLTSHWPRGWLKDVAHANMYVESTREETSQPLRSWLKSAAW